MDTVIEEMKNAAVRCREVHAAFGDAAVQQSAPESLSVSSQVHTFKRKKLGSFQSDDIQGAGTNRSPLTAPDAARGMLSLP